MFSKFKIIVRFASVFAVTLLENSDEWQHEIPPRGGFILRLDE
jgi:hypothetical protein